MYDPKSKAKNISISNEYMFAKTISMFEWENLPETIPYNELERLLQRKGYAFITDVGGELYAFTGGLGGEPDVYGNPTEIVITNPSLNLAKTFNLLDGVLLVNDDGMLGFTPLFEKYNSLMVENDITLYLKGISNRIQALISATDDKTKASADEFIKRLIDGEFSTIAESALFDSLKTHAFGSTQPGTITSLIEYQQYLRATLFNEVGLNSNFNMKRERLVTAEVEQGDDILYPFIDNMMKVRLKGAEKLNEKYGLNVKVDYGSVWSHKNKNLVDDIVESGEPQLNTLQNESLQESLQESLDESLQESLNESKNDIDEIYEILKGDLTEVEREQWEQVLNELLERENDEN